MSGRRLGFSFLYFTSRVTEEHLPWMGRLAAHGYDGAELPVAEASQAELLSMRRALEVEGLAATALGFVTPEANPIDPDPKVRRAAVGHLGRLAERAAALGAEVLAGPLHSANGQFSGQPATGDERKWCAEVLHGAGEHAAKLGVTLALEPQSRFETHFLNTAADCAALVWQVGHPHVVGALDTHHAHIEESSIREAVEAMGAALGHVQLSENHRGVLGRGQVDFHATLKSLDDMSYNGWLVVESFSRRDAELGAALRIWRSLDHGVDEVLAAGLGLVRRLERPP